MLRICLLISTVACGIPLAVRTESIPARFAEQHGNSVAGAICAQLIVPKEIPSPTSPPKSSASSVDASSDPKLRGEHGVLTFEQIKGSWFASEPGKSPGERLGIELRLWREISAIKGTMRVAGPTPEGDKVSPPMELKDLTIGNDGFEFHSPALGSNKRQKFALKGETLESVDEYTLGVKLILKRSNPEAERLFRNAKSLTPEELARGREAAAGASCANNLKQLGLICKMFANENKGQVLPELSPQSGRLMWVPESVFPEYLTDCRIMVCPNTSRAQALLEQKVIDPKSLVDDQSYIYLGYAVTNDEEFKAFIDAYLSRVASGGRFDDDLVSPSGATVYRLREGVERFFTTDSKNPAACARAQATIPVLIERPGNHPGMGNVLYLDGHVERRKCPGEFPYTPAVVDGLQKIATLKSAKTEQ